MSHPLSDEQLRDFTIRAERFRARFEGLIKDERPTAPVFLDAVCRHFAELYSGGKLKDAPGYVHRAIYLFLSTIHEGHERDREAYETAREQANRHKSEGFEN